MQYALLICETSDFASRSADPVDVPYIGAWRAYYRSTRHRALIVALP
jgi:hypothetical protein